MKRNRCGQAYPVRPGEYQKVRSKFNCETHKLIWDIAYYTGERAGAILQLEVADVYETWNKMKPRYSLLFKGRTRKDKKSREVPCHDVLLEILKAYNPPELGYLFPSPADSTKPLSLRAYDGALKRAVSRANLTHKGISTHSTRRAFIQQLHKKGISLRTIQGIMGYASLNMLTRYVDVDDDLKAAAISLIE